MRIQDSRVRRLQKSGFSLSVNIPVSFVRAMGLVLHQEIRIYVMGRAIVIQPTQREGFAPAVIPVPSRGPVDEVTHE